MIAQGLLRHIRLGASALVWQSGVGCHCMQLREIETFYWTATIGNFARAAERLETSQATVSARIAALERRLGLKLFDRSKRSARLTARGREMLGWAESILRLARDAEAAMADPTALGGTVRLGVSE